jgi:hypothetical protein
MASTSFDDFVRRQSEAVKLSEETPVDWQAQKAEWLRYLDSLYSQVNQYLKSYVDAGDIVIGFQTINLNEEYIGPYSAREMIITIGGKVIKLEPIGTLLIGSRGRVDAVGPLARAQIILLGADINSLSQLIHVSVSMGSKPPSPPPSKPRSDIKWTWKIVMRPPRREVIELNKESFLNLLMEISNG